MTKTATWIRDLDTGGLSALYRTAPPFMGCEWVATRAHLRILGSSVWLFQSSQVGTKLAGLASVADTSDDGVAFGAFGYEVCGAPAREFAADKEANQ